jgi:hypothetical protein
VERALHLAVVAQDARRVAERVLVGDDVDDAKAPVLVPVRRALALDDDRDRDRRPGRRRHGLGIVHLRCPSRR